jgi:hypothetical protein
MHRFSVSDNSRFGVATEFRWISSISSRFNKGMMLAVVRHPLGRTRGVDLRLRDVATAGSASASVMQSHRRPDELRRSGGPAQAIGYGTP